MAPGRRGDAIDAHVGRRGLRGRFPPASQRFLLPLIVTAVMVAVVTGMTTVINLGLASEVPRQWLRAYLVAWPIAFVTLVAILPTVLRLVGYLVRPPG